MKYTIKQFLYRINALHFLDKIKYHIDKIKYKKINKKFKETSSDFALPSDYFLYETYRLNYLEYKEDGFNSASEIVSWTQKYIMPENVLEWGCGVARIVRHLPHIYKEGTTVFACDINPEMIAWDKLNIPNVIFDLVDYMPPTHYKQGYFQLVYAISVFTHIDAHNQKHWLQEVYRILSNNGVFLFTTHGNYYLNHLSKKQISTLLHDGMYTITYNKKGHRMMTTYHTNRGMSELLSPLFEILEYYDGEKNLEKLGGQDLWIVRKISQ